MIIIHVEILLLFFIYYSHDVLDLPSIEIVSLGEFAFEKCHLVVFDSMWWLFTCFHFILILDLPKLRTITFSGGHCLKGVNQNKVTNNGYKDYTNTLIMKSTFKWNVTGYLSNWIDLPSLSTIRCQGYCRNIHQFIGHVVLESMIWYDLIWHTNVL